MGQLFTERSPESNNLLVKSQNFDYFLLSSNHLVHNSPIASTMNLKLALNFVIKNSFILFLRSWFWKNFNKNISFSLQFQRPNWWRFNSANFKMSNLALMRINYALNCVNRAKKRDFYIFYRHSMPLNYFFTFCLDTIVANYQNYHIIKWKIYVDDETKVIRLS
jgi:hypothetical protein